MCRVNVNCRIFFLLVVTTILSTSVVKADSIFDRIRAFTPEESIRQSRFTDSIRAMTLPGSNGSATNQNISETCQFSNPGALNGNPCCRHLVTEECTLAVSRGLCPSGFRYDVGNKCSDDCNDPPKPSPSASAFPSRSASMSPSRSPSALPSTLPVNRWVIEISDSENARPDYDDYANNSCSVQGGTKIANGRACEFRACSYRPFQAGFRGNRGSSVLRSNSGCNSQALTLCNWDCSGVDNAIMYYGLIPPPPPPVTRSPAATRSMVPSGSVTPFRSASPNQSRTPHASGTPYPSYSPFPSRSASQSGPTVTPSRYSNASN